MRFRKPSLIKISRYADWKVRPTQGGGYVAYRSLETETVELSRSSVLRLATIPQATPETLDLLEKAGIA